MATRLHTRRRFAGGDESKFDALSENFVAPKKVTHTPESYQEIVWFFLASIVHTKELHPVHLADNNVRVGMKNGRDSCVKRSHYPLRPLARTEYG